MFDTRNSLVLSGGNVKGSYQAGALKALFNHTFPDGSKFKPGAIYGVSVGAMNGGFIADRAGQAALKGQEPDWPEIGNELEAFWRDNITSFASIGKKRSAFSLAFKIIGGKFNGLTKMDGAAELARANIRYENLKASKTYYACGVTNMRTGDYFDADVGTFGEDILDYVVASTREPVNMPIMWVKDQPLVDGGVRNIAPLAPAIKRGAEKMAIIAMKPDHMSVVESQKEFGNMLKLLKRTLGTLTNEIMNNDLEKVRDINAACQRELDAGEQVHTAGKRIIEFVEVRPQDRLDIDSTDFTSNDIKRLIKQGEEEAKEQLAKGWLTGNE